MEAAEPRDGPAGALHSLAPGDEAPPGARNPGDARILLDIQRWVPQPCGLRNPPLPMSRHYVAITRLRRFHTAQP